MSSYTKSAILNLQKWGLILLTQMEILLIFFYGKIILKKS